MERARIELPPIINALDFVSRDSAKEGHPIEPDLEAAGEDYAARFAGPIGVYLLSRQGVLVERQVKALVRLSSERRLLDVGGGHAQILGQLEGRPGIGLSVLATSSEALGRAAALVARGSVRSHLGSLLCSGLESRSFDLVTCIRLLPHVEDWRALVAELCRLSSDSVLVDYPPRASCNLLYDHLFTLKKGLEGNTRSFRLFSHSEVADEFARHGFRLEWREGQFLFPMVLYRVLKSPTLCRLLELPGALTGLRSRFGNPTIAVFSRMTVEKRKSEAALP